MMLLAGIGHELQHVSLVQLQCLALLSSGSFSDFVILGFATILASSWAGALASLFLEGAAFRSICITLAFLILLVFGVLRSRPFGLGLSR